MNSSRDAKPRFTYLPVTPERWPDMQALFEASGSEDLGNPSRCWCMEMQLRNHDQWRQQCQLPRGEANRQAMEALIQSEAIPGILAYDGDQAVGWCSVSPREQLTGLPRTHTVSSARASGVWSIVCFYVSEARRGEGLMKGLLRAAVEYALDAGATIVEGYPLTPDVASDGALGLVPIFEAVGFVEVGSVNPTQPVMHYVLNR